MSETTHDDFTSGKHRADEIHVHRRGRKGGPWLGLGALGIGLLALWGYGRSREHIAATTCAEATFHFASSQSSLSADDKMTVRHLADCLRANPSQTVRLEGHADASESPSANDLARGRAEALVRRLAALGVPESQLEVAIGATTPCTDHTDTCLQKNRSVLVSPLPRH